MNTLPAELAALLGATGERRAPVPLPPGATVHADEGDGPPVLWMSDGATNPDIAAVVLDWERRFGARVVGVGFAELYLSVAAPPTTAEEALRVAAEHFAFCPDNIWQGRHPHTLAAYAEGLVDATAWTFWWD